MAPYPIRKKRKDIDAHFLIWCQLVSNWCQKGVLPTQNALIYVLIYLKILLASPKITLLQVQILVIGLLQNLLFIGKL